MINASVTNCGIRC